MGEHVGEVEAGEFGAPLRVRPSTSAAPSRPTPQCFGTKRTGLGSEAHSRQQPSAGVSTIGATRRRMDSTPPEAAKPKAQREQRAGFLDGRHRRGVERRNPPCAAAWRAAVSPRDRARDRHHMYRLARPPEEICTSAAMATSPTMRPAPIPTRKGSSTERFCTMCTASRPRRAKTRQEFLQRRLIPCGLRTHRRPPRRHTAAATAPAAAEYSNTPADPRMWRGPRPATCIPDGRSDPLLRRELGVYVEVTRAPRRRCGGWEDCQHDSHRTSQPRAARAGRPRAAPPGRTARGVVRAPPLWRWGRCLRLPRKRVGHLGQRLSLSLDGRGALLLGRGALRRCLACSGSAGIVLGSCCGVHLGRYSGRHLGGASLVRHALLRGPPQTDCAQRLGRSRPQARNVVDDAALHAHIARHTTTTASRRRAARGRARRHTEEDREHGIEQGVRRIHACAPA